MNINILSQIPSTSTPQPEVNSLQFESTDNGKTYRSIVPIAALPGHDNTAGDLVVNEIVDITSEVETTKRGVRRILLKATMPYVSVTEQKCCGSTESTVSVNTARTNESMSCHIVFTIPAGAVKDAAAQGNTRDAVFTKVYLLQYLIQTLLRTDPTYGQASLETKVSTATLGETAGAVLYNGQTVFVDLPTGEGVNGGYQAPLGRGIAGLLPLSNSTYGVQ